MYRPDQLVGMQIARCEAEFISAKNDFEGPGGERFDRQRMQDAHDEKTAWQAVRNLMELGRQFENPMPIDKAPLDRRVLLRHPFRGWITGQWSEADGRWEYADTATFGKMDTKNNQPLIYLELPK